MSSAPSRPPSNFRGEKGSPVATVASKQPVPEPSSRGDSLSFEEILTKGRSKLFTDTLKTFSDVFHPDLWTRKEEARTQGEDSSVVDTHIWRIMVDIGEARGSPLSMGLQKKFTILSDSLNNRQRIREEAANSRSPTTTGHHSSWKEQEMRADILRTFEGLSDAFDMVHAENTDQRNTIAGLRKTNVELQNQLKTDAATISHGKTLIANEQTAKKKKEDEVEKLNKKLAEYEAEIGTIEEEHEAELEEKRQEIKQKELQIRTQAEQSRDSRWQGGVPGPYGSWGWMRRIGDPSAWPGIHTHADSGFIRVHWPIRASKTEGQTNPPPVMTLIGLYDQPSGSSLAIEHGSEERDPYTGCPTSSQTIYLKNPRINVPISVSEGTQTFSDIQVAPVITKEDDDTPEEVRRTPKPKKALDSDVERNKRSGNSKPRQQIVRKGLDKRAGWSWTGARG